MEKSESIINLVKATINVMQVVENIEKKLNVGTGGASYKGVADKDVKQIIGNAMAENGLVIYPIGIKDDVIINNWEETTTYGVKQKQNVLTKITSKYLLCHESGEYITLTGYGHGVDSQDKSAGKATTYALKYTLLYTFLVPTGKIDDADNVHSNDIKQPLTVEKTVKELEPIIKAIKTGSVIVKIWNENQHLHTDEGFLQLLKEQKELINGNN